MRLLPLLRSARPACGAIVLIWAWCALGQDNLSVFKLGERFYSDSLYNMAIEQYQKYLGLARTPEKDPTAHFRIGVAHFRMGSFQSAADALEEYLRLFPSDQSVSEALFTLGQTHAQMGNHKQSLEHYYAVWSRFVGSALSQRALLAAANEARHDSNTERAIELFELYNRRFPKSQGSQGVVLSLAELYLERKEYVQAAKMLESSDSKWLTDKTYLARSLYLRAKVAVETRKDTDAAVLFKSMIDAGSTDFAQMPQAYTDYIDFLTRQGEFGASLPLFKALSEKTIRSGGKPSERFVFDWAEAAQRAKEFVQAEELYGSLLGSRDSGSVDTLLVRFRIAECRVGKGEFSRAIESLQSLAAIDSLGEYGARAVLRIGDLYYKREQYLGAIPAYRTYLQLDGQKNQDAILFRVASIYQNQFNQYGTALREYENLLRRFPTSSFYSRCVFAMAQCYEKLDRVAEAIQHYGYLLEAGAQGELVDNARDRVSYLTTFRVRDSDAAVYALAGQLEQLAGGESTQTTPARMLQLLEVYEKHLKDHQKALTIATRMLAQDALSDTLRAELELAAARNCEFLAQRARFESNPSAQAHYTAQAVAIYTRLVAEVTPGRLTDEAAFRLMMLGNPSIGDLESYVQKYATSAHLDEVLVRIARYYEERIATVDRAFARKALNAYGELNGRFPSAKHTPVALLGIARNALELSLIDTTAKYAGRFLELFPNSELRPEALFLKGQVQKRGRDSDGAIETFKTVLYQYPFSSLADDARFELGSALFAANNFFEAAENFRLYVEQYPDGESRARAVFFLGRSLARTGKSQDAQRLFNELLTEGVPPQVQAGIHHELARLAEEQQDRFKALNHYRQVLAEPSYAQKAGVYAYVGRLYFDSRLFADAEKAFKQGYAAATTAIDTLESWKGYIKSLIMGGKGKEADKEFKSFQDRYEGRPADIADIIYHEGLFLVAEKKYEPARNRFRFVLKRFGTTDFVDDASYQEALSLYYEGDREKALAGFNEFATRYPQSEYLPSALFKIGMIHHEREDFRRAAEYFTQVGEHPRVDSLTRLRALHNAGVDYQKSSAWALAAQMYQKVLTLFPDQAQESSMHLKIGFCLVQANRFEEALSSFAKAEKNPSPADKPEILYWTGMCQAKLGNIDAAITEFLKVPYLYAGVGKWGITSEFEAARLYERTGEYERAGSLYRKIVQSDGEQGDFGKRALAQLERIQTLIQ